MYRISLHCLGLKISLFWIVLIIVSSSSIGLSFEFPKLLINKRSTHEEQYISKNQEGNELSLTELEPTNTGGNIILSLNDTDDDQLIKSREKRFIYKNIDGTFDVGIQGVIPLTIILPPVTNLFTKWRNKRSLHRRIGHSSMAIDILPEVPEEFEDEYYLDDEDPFIQTHLDRINSYFELIQIYEPSCQQRAICEFSADPSKYYPISDLFLTQIRSVPIEYLENIENATTAQSTPGNDNITSSAQKSSRFKLYSLAFDHGLIHGHEKCHTRYSNKCFYSIDQRLDMKVLKYWGMLGSLLGIKISDTSST